MLTLIVLLIMLGLGIYLFFSFNSTLINIKMNFIKLSQIDRSFFKKNKKLKDDVISSFLNLIQINRLLEILLSLFIFIIIF